MRSIESFRINTPKISHETIDGEVVIINFDNGNYYSIDKVGAEIWWLIEKNTPLREIIERVNELYEGEPEVIQNAVTQLITELHQEELIIKAEVEKIKKDGEVKNVSSPVAEKPKFEMPILQKYDDMQDLLLLDPIHEVDETGWPSIKPNATHKDE